jgi:hypothetical protein
MYYVYEANGQVAAVCSREEDAKAMCQTTSDEPPRHYVKKEVDKPEE